MHGRAAEERRRGRHMWTGATRGNLVVVGDVSSSSSSISPANSFSKDGRTISVGDCALFKPPQDSPPFIGIIRWLTHGKENELRLCVNWLYRPSEVKLGKGILLEAAPNELFYSFHKDEIPAASLLHPCKVSFLAKGVELPSGISSFVCRRVYDITNKCLWWLTDQDYIDERQEEVDKLLYKTRIEMHPTAQAGGRSPKPVNIPNSSSQLKPSSDNIHNNTSSFPSQVKGKKRDRVDQGSEPIKRERSSKMDDRPESFWRSEISKFTEKGGLVDPKSVEKLVQLMHPERSDKKIDLVGRSILAGVIAATDKFDCLNRFVQLRGLTVFDDWLHEVRKGEISEIGKDNEKPIEEFLIVLLRALDKLPVNLHALQMCYIGKSVNHLRTHKNLEIQKKARSIVDTWKKRVMAEIEVSQGGNRNSGTTSEIAMKSSAAQLLASKCAPVKLVQGDPKSVSAPPGSLKSPPSLASVGNNLKDGHALGTGVAAVCDTPAGDDKSSSSSQSHNNSQSCSSDHAKTGGYFGKEDAKSSTAASNKGTGRSSRHRKSSNGFPGPNSPSVQKETGSGRNLSVQRNLDAEKLPQSSSTCEKVDVPNHKLIVKLSNRGRSPGRSSPQIDQSSKDKNVAGRVNLSSDVNAESWQSVDLKEVLTNSEEGDQSPATLPDEENSRTGGDMRKLAGVSKAATSPSGNECKSMKLQDDSYSSMNALIESCAKFSEPNVSSISGDDVGMNLLASVATGEMSKLDPPSPQRKATIGENTDSIIKSSPGDNFAPDDKSVISPQEKLIPELNGHSNSHVDVKKVSEPCLESNVKTEDNVKSPVLSSSIAENPSKGIEKSNDGVQSVPKEASNSFDQEDKVPGVVKTETASTELTALQFEETKGGSGEILHCSGNDTVSEKVNAVKTEEADCGSPALKKQKTQESNIGEPISDEHISSQKLSPTIHDPEADETEESTAGDSNKEEKIEFDLNEGLNGDDGRFGESFSSVQLVSPLSLPVSSGSSCLPASVTVASAAKRPFVPPEDLIKNKVELGWRGSAATSAFRPAEPRKPLELPLTISSSKATRSPLDFDLNVVDVRIQDDMAFRMATSPVCELANNSGGLDLDLNRMDEPADIVTNNGPTGEVRVRRDFDFDLNDGPLADEASVEQSTFGQHARNTAPAHTQPSPSNIRITNADVGNFSSWPFPVLGPGGPQRMLGPTGTPFPPPILSSSPAAVPFQYPVFSFGNFPTAFSGGSSAYVDPQSGGRICFPGLIHSQVLPSHFNRPFVAGLPDGNSAEGSRKWGRQGLDLNSGPLGPDMEGRDDTSSIVLSRQLAEEQARIYQMQGGAVLKRKEPDGGWDGVYKQAPWQ